MRQAVLLVGGRATRVWPLSHQTPKGLLPVAGVPFIEYQLRLVARVGVTEVILAVGHHHLPAWEDYVARWDGTPSLSLSIEDEPLDTGGPVVEALDHLDGEFLVLNGDVVLDVDLGVLIEGAPEDAAATIALVRVDDPSAYGVVVTDADRSVDRFVEKPAPGTAPADTVNAGIYVMSRDALAAYQRGPLSFERVVFPDLAKRRRLGGVVVEGTWLDIGTPDLLLDTNGFVLGGGSSLHEPESPHAGTGGVREGGWSWVAPGAQVASDAVVAESLVLDGAVIEAGAVIRRGLVGWGAKVGSETTVTGSAVIGPGAVVGAGCEFDAGVRVGPGAEVPDGSITFNPPA
jgi:NDP-sugar pyrophosphorylase family protein